MATAVQKRSAKTCAISHRVKACKHRSQNRRKPEYDLPNLRIPALTQVVSKNLGGSKFGHVGNNDRTGCIEKQESKRAEKGGNTEACHFLELRAARHMKPQP